MLNAHQTLPGRPGEIQGKKGFVPGLCADGNMRGSAAVEFVLGSTPPQGHNNARAALSLRRNLRLHTSALRNIENRYGQLGGLALANARGQTVLAKRGKLRASSIRGE